MRASRTELADLMAPLDANSNGTVFGGRILQMVDKAAGVCAMRHAGPPCVTVAMDRVEFLVPIYLGELVTVQAQVNYVGRTSMEIGVEVYTEDLDKGSRRHANSCLVTMVAIDRRQKPRGVPGLIVETPDERRRWSVAEKRRAARRAKA